MGRLAGGARWRPLSTCSVLPALTGTQRMLHLVVSPRPPPPPDAENLVDFPRGLVLYLMGPKMHPCIHTPRGQLVEGLLPVRLALD